VSCTLSLRCQRRDDRRRRSEGTCLSRFGRLADRRGTRSPLENDRDWRGSERDLNHPFGELANTRRHRRERPQGGDLLLDLALAPVLRRREHALVIVRRQMTCQQTDRCQRDGTFSQQFDDDRKSPRCTCGFDPVVGGVFGQAQTPRAKRKSDE
jgi:hypothetical protein